LNAGAVVSDQELVSQSKKPRKVAPYRSGLKGNAEALIAWEELGLDGAVGLLKETLEEEEAWQRYGNYWMENDRSQSQVACCSGHCGEIP
jgi:hypothetical protein